MRADKVMVWIILAVIVGVGVLLIKNRGSEKIFAVLTVILSTTLATGLGSLLLILRPETSEDEFVSTFIYDTKAARPLLWESFPIRKRFMGSAEIWDKSSQDERQGESLQVLRDYLARCMVEEMMQKYHAGWLIQTKAWNVPGSSQSSFGPIEEAAKLPRMQRSLDEMLAALKVGGNRFADVRTTGSSVWGAISLPPDTTFSYSSNAGQEAQLTLKNPYVAITVTVFPSSMAVLQQDFYDVFEVRKGELNRYYQVSYRVKIKSRFSSWRAGWERMTHQKRWAGSIVFVLRDAFDWEKCAAEIKEAWQEKQLSKIK